MKRAILILLAVSIGLRVDAIGSGATSGEMFDLVKSHVRHLNIKPADLQALTEKRVITRGISSKNSKELAGFGAVLAEAPPDAFVESYRSLETLRNNPHINNSGRFSPTPTIDDLKDLEIDDNDLFALAKCRPGDSDIKLSEGEMAQLQKIVPAGTRLTPQLKARLGAEYKKLLLDRVKSYLANGTTSLGVYRDKGDSVDAREAFLGLSREQSELLGDCGHTYSYMEKYPAGDGSGSESFIYWAKQKFGDLKPVINLVHVLIHKEGDRVFIISKQIYASHYTEAAISTAELIPFGDGHGQTRTIITYTIRLQVDMLGGTLGFMKKRMAQPRMVGTLKESLNGLRVNLEASARSSNQPKVGS